MQTQAAVSDTERAGRTSQRAPRRRSPVVPASICVVEDDDDIREALEELLTSVGYEVRGYDRADEALRGLEREAPDLILLDLMMPGMNGWQFRVEQKRRPALRDIPVVVLSADGSPYAVAIDADAYVQKPVDFDRLQSVLEQVLLSRERKRLSAKSMELERVRSLGMLVASVAHEINNPLTYVLGSLDLIERQRRALLRSGADVPSIAEKQRDNIEAAVDGAQRVASIVRLLSTFSRADDTSTGTVNPVRAIEAAARLAMHQIEPKARLVTTLEPVPNVLGNEARLAQVILNLLINAAHAISDDDEHEHEVRAAASVKGQKVQIEVSDDGVGIDAELVPRIFEPFFTTKPPGLGTGLGLSIARDIVSSMGGNLQVSSTTGVGTTFRILLPVADGEGRPTDDDGSDRSRRSRVTSKPCLARWSPRCGDSRMR